MSARTILTAAGMIAGLAGLSTQAQVAAPAAGPAGQTGATAATESLKKVSELLTVSKVVRANALLASLAGESATMSDADRKEAARLLNAVKERSRGLGTLELSLQRADLALENGDLRLASQHAKAVATDKSATVEQHRQADEYLNKIDARREELAAKVPDAIRTAVNHFDQGHYEQCKSIFEMVSRSGVTLSAEQQAQVTNYSVRIIELEQARAAKGDAAAGMLQPGVIKKRSPEEGDKGAEGAPALAAAPEQPAGNQPDALADARKASLTEILKKSDDAFSARRFSEAKAGYERAKKEFADLLSADQAGMVDQRITTCQVELKHNVGPEGGVIDQFKGDVTLRKQQFMAEFRNTMNQAAAAKDGGNVTEAENLLAEANLLRAKNADVLTEAEKADYKKQVDVASADVAAARQAIAAREAKAREEALKNQADREKGRNEQEKIQKIRENLDRVRALQVSRNYNEALQVVQQVLFLQPDNPTALLLKDVLQDMKIYYEYNRIQDGIGRELQVMAIKNLDTLRPPREIMDYPQEWPNISQIRGEPVAFQETPENRQILAKLDSQRIPAASFPDVPLEAALDYVKRVGTLNMDVDWPSLEAVGIQKDTTVLLNISNPTLKTVLDRVLEKVSTSTDINARAGWTVNDGVLQVASEEALRRRTIMVIYDVRDLLLEIRDKTNAPTFDLNSAFQSGGGGGGGGQSPFQNQGNQNDPRGLQRPIEDRIRDLRNIITEQIDHDGWQENGGSTGFIREWQGNLIITNTPKNHRAIEGLLSQLRKVRNMQINVEARFLLVNQDFFEQIGFDVDVYLNARSNMYRFVRGFDRAVWPSDFFTDQGTFNHGNISSGTNVLDTDGDGIPDAPLPNGGVGPTVPENFTVVGITQRSLGITGGLMNSSFANEVRANGPALGISGTFLDDVQVDFLVQATQADRRSVTVTAPRLTFTNGQFANMYVATQVAYVQDLTPIVSEGAAAFDSQIAYANEGVRLLVGGTISSDRRYVTLDVDTQVSQLKRPFRTREVNAVVAGVGGGGGGIQNSGSVGSFVELPETTIQSVSTTVTVPDQGTILLGGQKIASEVEVESGVPVLSKIPILNRFFSNRAISKEDRTLLMLIKPTILIQDEQEEKNFPGLRDAIRAGIGG